jgi:hypothetical protein
MRHELRRIIAAYLAAGRRHFVVDARLKESPHRPHLVSVQRPFYNVEAVAVKLLY